MSTTPDNPLQGLSVGIMSPQFKEDTHDQFEVYRGSRQNDFAIYLTNPPNPIATGEELSVSVNVIAARPSHGQLRLLKNGAKVYEQTFDATVFNSAGSILPVTMTVPNDLVDGEIYQWHVQQFTRDWSQKLAEHYVFPPVVVAPDGAAFDSLTLSNAPTSIAHGSTVLIDVDYSAKDYRVI